MTDSGICQNAYSQYTSSTFSMSTTNDGCLQARMDAMIPYFNACSLSVVPDSFFGFKSGSNYYYSPEDFQWYCYTKYGLLLTGKGLPAVPPATEPRDPLAPLPTLTGPPPPPPTAAAVPAATSGATAPSNSNTNNTPTGTSSSTSTGLSSGEIGGIVVGVAIGAALFAWWRRRSSAVKQSDIPLSTATFANVPQKSESPSVLSGHTEETAEARYNQLDYDQPRRHYDQFNGGPGRSMHSTPSVSTAGFPSEKRAGGLNQNRAYMAPQQQQSRPSEKSGRSFDVYGQLEQRHNSGGGAGGSSVGTGNTSGGVPVQIVYIQPETDGLPVVAPPAYANY
ncbi:hypothetical protein HDU98_011098 [Podochytrium sp. JEL0797]|nr:hypothetical protein HDU98_011098 [Podochytrium sp. JEL0797]